MTGITRLPGMTRLQGGGGVHLRIFFQGHISHFSKIPIRDLSL